jgi:D-3-phosphoglycerate dehydrogenase
VTQTSKRLTVALVDLDGQQVPAWVPETLAPAGIDLIVRQCDNGADLAHHAAAAEVVWLFGGSRVLQGNLQTVPRCWAIVRTGSGTDNVPVEEATRRGIVVANTPAAFSDPVSDHVIALLFAVARRLCVLERAVRLGRWDQSLARSVTSVKGRTLGLVGFGHIAQEVTRKLSGFTMKVLAHDPYVDADTMARHGVQAAGLDALLAAADFISLHCPHTRETEHLIGEKQLRMMKPTCVLLNTSRGPVVDESALIRALNEGWIAAAGLDVLEVEPPAPDNPLLKLDNVVLSPHAAGFSADWVDVRWRLSVETLIALARRQWPPSCVNRKVQPAQELRPSLPPRSP